ncbi:hypothetical protein [Acinetobacter lactucae]|uniref:hypothetical protein n=1 Tax=Acinetobacter lactucae TaxID=1785128 RepID=UPI00077E21AC|nr:hypothetical protein [Acinetobacter lactucae]
MYNDHNNCSGYSEYAEWLRLSDILNEWCKADRTCREVKQLAILGACENGEIAYTRSDGKNFDDPVIDLQGRGILLINKSSFNEWKNRIEQIETLSITTQPHTNLLDFLNSIDSEYISIGDAIDAIHKHIGLDQDINKAIQVLNLAIGKAPNKPNIYKRYDFSGWEKVTITQQYGSVAIHWFAQDQYITEVKKTNTIRGAIDLEINTRRQKELDDELPF